MDFSVTKSKCQYAFIRVGYSNNGKDNRCDYNRQAAIANDFPYGPYWYCRPGLDWKQHADNFARIAGEYPFQLDMVLDVETTMLNPTDTLNWLINLNGRLVELTGKKPMIYTSGGFWNSAIPRNTYFAGHRLWVASWTTGDTPYMVKDWSSWTHWQWSADNNGMGAEYGSGPDGDPDMDLNRYNGTVDSFNAMYGTHIVPIGTPEPPHELFIVRTTAGSLFLRKSPYGAIVGHVQLGTLLGVNGSMVDNYGKLWYRVGECYTASWWCEGVE